MRTARIQDVLCLAVPLEVEDRPTCDLHSLMDGIAVRAVAEQYGDARPASLVFERIEWLVTGEQDDVERFQPAHDCAACRAGNDQARTFLRENPDRKIALANITYTEVWR